MNHLLIVEDDENLLFLYQSILEQQNFTRKLTMFFSCILFSFMVSLVGFVLNLIKVCTPWVQLAYFLLIQNCFIIFLPKPREFTR